MNFGSYAPPEMGGDNTNLAGPFLNWKPEGDGVYGIPHQSFALKGHWPQDKKYANAVGPYMVFDVFNIRVGWTVFTTSRQWVYGDRGSLQYPPKPAATGAKDDKGNDIWWRPGFVVPAIVTLAGEQSQRPCVWNQDGRGASFGFEGLMRLMAEANPSDRNMLPVIQLVGSETLPPKGSKGKTTFGPKFQVVQWTARNASLAPDVDPIEQATGQQAQSAPAAAPMAPPTAPAPAQAVNPFGGAPATIGAPPSAPAQQPTRQAIAAAAEFQAPPPAAAAPSAPPAPNGAAVTPNDPFANGGDEIPF